MTTTTLIETFRRNVSTDCPLQLNRTYANLGGLNQESSIVTNIVAETSEVLVKMSSYSAIYNIVCQIPYGQVATYGQVADLANLPGRARLVGYALFRVPLDSEIPWHRVINAKGEVSESPVRYGGDYLQRSLLEAEGIPFNAQGKIDLRRYLWKPTLEG